MKNCPKIESSLNKNIKENEKKDAKFNVYKK